MGKTFRAYDMNQQLLLPPDLREWLREDHLALYVSGNLTDPDSRMMKDLVTQSFQQGYNAQIGVDAQAQIIVGAKVVQAENDQQQLVPVRQEVAQHLGRMPDAASADGGYFSTAALTHEAVRGVNLHVPPNEREPELGKTLPASASVQQRMWQKLKSPDGRATYNQRQAIVEPTFSASSVVSLLIISTRARVEEIS